MIKKYNEKYQRKMYNVFSEAIKGEGFFKELSFEEFKTRLFDNPNFDEEGTFLYIEEEIVKGFASSNLSFNSEYGYLHTIVVSKKYRRQGIGSKLLDACEEYIYKCEKQNIRFVFLSGICWPWHPYNNKKYIHPNSPGVKINGDLYLFLLKKRFELYSIHEGYCMDLDKFSIPRHRIMKNEDNKKKGLEVSLYDHNKHTGIDEFCNNLESQGFAKSIRSNLELENPYPFLVATKDNQVVGWTGAIYTEEDGRGHLDGITVNKNVSGNGLGTALFLELCNQNKMNKATYMTLFTGISNPAKYIYLNAGMSVACSFADMKKKIRR